MSLTFTTAPGTNSISFDLIFASEEFPTYVGSFNDAFGAYLDGTQISTDPSGNPITVSNDFLKLNNSGTNPPSGANGVIAGTTPVTFNLTYGGLTPELQTTAPLDPNVTTHTLKFVVGDAGDDEYDSAIFLADLQGSATSPGGPSTGNTPAPTPGSLQLDHSSATVADTAANVQLTVDRTGGSTGAVTVDYATSDETAVAGTNYTATSGTVDFIDGQTTATITVPIADLPGASATSAFDLTLSNPTGGASLGAQTSETVTIQNNQSLVQLSAATDSVSGDAGSELLTVNRTGNTSLSASVDYATSDGTALAGVDYTTTSGTLNFSAGQTSKTISVPLLNNTAGAASSTFSISLSNPVTGTIVGTQQSETVTIQNDHSQVNLSAATTTAANDSGSVTLTVNRTGNTAVAGSFDYATSNGTAVAGTDYATTSGTLNFSPGQTSLSIVVPLLDNTAAAATATFLLTLSNPVNGAVLGTQQSETVTIQNNQSQVNFGSATGNIANTAGIVTLEVDRTGNTTLAGSVDYSTSDGTATAGTDYTATSGTINFSAGQAFDVIAIPLLGNAAAPASSTFTVNLTNPGANTVAGAQGQTTVTLTNSQSLIQFASPSQVTSSGAATATLTVTRTGNTSTAASVHYATEDGTALVGVDYVGQSETLNFLAGQTAKQIVLSLLSGPAASAVTFSVQLSSLGGSGVLGTATTSTVTIPHQQSFVEFSAAQESVSGDAGSVTLTVTRTGDTTSAASLDFATWDGTAVAGTDYTAMNGTINFPAGENQETINIPLLANYAAAATSAFTVTLANPTGNAQLSTNQSTTVTVLNRSSQVQFDQSNYSLNEDDGSAIITVTRAGNLSAAGSVDYATQDGTAIAGRNYTSAAGTLTFAAGQTTASFQIPVLNDNAVDPTLTVGITLLNPSSSVRLGAQQSATLSILDVPPPLAIVDNQLTLDHPGVVNPVTFPGFNLVFNQPLSPPPTAQDFSLSLRTKDGVGGTGTSTQLGLVSVTYDAADNSILFKSKNRLRSNHFYQLVGSNVSGLPDGALNYWFALGRRFTYIDRDGNLVHLSLQGKGYMRLTRTSDGQGDILTLYGVNSRSELRGSVQKTKLGGSGVTTLNLLTGIGAAIDSLPRASFTIGG